MNDKLAIAWCDNGMVDGKFMQGVTDVMLHSGVEVVTTLRSQGNQIARQRDKVINYWYENNKSDWLLWVDSDVVISPDTFKLLWDNKNIKERPILSGVYFTTDQPEESLMTPMPTLFNFVVNNNQVGVTRIHPLPKDKLIKIGAAGMGYVLMHRSVVDRIRLSIPEGPLFSDIGHGKNFLGEDIFFFALCDKADVPVYAHTGATVPHMKRFSFDENYYDAFVGQKRK
jgi:glycosyltransferase involved in cell wall biosynthesis